MIFRSFLTFISVALLLAAAPAQAQQYRWIDKDGRVQFTDAPPPPWARDVRRTNITPAKPAAPPMPYEVARAHKDFPVTVYTSPNCAEICETVRGALNKRGVPFKEMQVWNQETADELKKVSGALEVPTMLVGRQALAGYEQAAFDALLDNAGYPKAGTVPPLQQKAPPVPEGYLSQDAPKPKPAPVAQPKPGPYDTSGLKGPPPKQGQYDPSGLTGPPPKQGQYGVPGEAAPAETK